MLALLALGATWGSSYLFIKVLVEETSALEVATGRMALGGLAVIAIVAWRAGPRWWRPSRWFKLTALAVVIIVLPFLLIAWAEEHIASGTASVLNSTQALWAALFAAVFLVDEQLTPTRLAGLVTGFVGVIVFTGGNLYDFTDSSVVGQLAVLIASAGYAGGTVYARNLLREEDPLVLTATLLVIGTLLLMPAMFAVRGTPDYSLSLQAWLSLLALGVLATGLGLAVYMWLVDNVGSVRSALVGYVIPVVGLLLGWAVLSEPVGLNTLLGLGLIVAGVGAVMRGRAPASQRLPVAADVGAGD